MNVATLADMGRHLSQDVTDTCRTFKNVAALETHLFCNVPKGINNVCRGVISTIGTHHRLLVCSFAKQLTKSLCNKVGSIICSLAESLSESAPTAELTECLHLLFGSLFATLKQLLCQLNSLDVGFYTCIYRSRGVVFASLRMVVPGILRLGYGV